MSLAGAIMAYLVPVAFGLGVYLTVSSKPSRVAATAYAWGVGWLFVHLALFVPDQFLAVRLDRSWYASVSTGMGVAAAGLIAWRRDRLQELLRPPPAPTRGTFARAWAPLIPLVALAALILYKGLVTPPASTDAIVYHLVLPRETVEEGSLPVRPGVGWLDLVTVMPGLLVTQQAWLHLGAGGFSETTVRPVVPLYSVLLLAMVFVDTRRWFGRIAAPFAAGLLFTLNEFAAVTAAMWAEVPVAFFAWLGVRLATTLRAGASDWRNIVGAGASLGGAALTKYNGLVLLVAVAAAFGILTLHARIRWRAWGDHRAALGVPAVALAVAAPLLVRNLLVLGNPIYPAFFGGVNTEAINALFVYPEGDDLRIRLMEGVMLVGMLPAALVGVGWLRRKTWTSRERFLLLVVSVFMFIFLYFPFRGSYIRYMAPVLPVLAILAGRQLSWWLTEASAHDKLRGAGIMAIFAAAVLGLLGALDVHPDYVVASATAFIVGAAALALLVLAGRSPRARHAGVVAVVVVLVVPGALAVVGERYPPRETAWDLSFLPPERGPYLEARLGDDWRMWQWMNANLRDDARVLTFEPRTLYLEAEIVFGAGHEMVPTLGMDLDEAVQHARDLGVDHILDSPWSHVPEVNRVVWERSVVFQNLDNTTRFRPVHTEGEVVLYALVE